MNDEKEDQIIKNMIDSPETIQNISKYCPTDPNVICECLGKCSCVETAEVKS